MENQNLNDKPDAIPALASAPLLDDTYNISVEDFILEMKPDGSLLKHGVPESRSRRELECVLPADSFEFVSHDGPEWWRSKVAPEGRYLYRVKRVAGDYFALSAARRCKLAGGSDGIGLKRVGEFNHSGLVSSNDRAKPQPEHNENSQP